MGDERLPESRFFIGVDWGTTNARFMLIDPQGSIKEQRSGPGIAQLDGSAEIEDLCFEMIGDWLEIQPETPVVLAGMVGSNIGWRTTEYAPVPTGLSDLTDHILRFQERGAAFFLVPGLSTMRHDNLPDVMRGEELQIFGLDENDAVVCLPGTHSKWAELSEGRVVNFHTALTGEMLDIIGTHSILLEQPGPIKASPSDMFKKGVTCAMDSRLGAESLLFTARSSVVCQDIPAGDAPDFLAGLVIGSEIKSTVSLHGSENLQAKPLVILGAAQLTALYSAALDAFGLRSISVASEQASANGFLKIFRKLEL